MPATATLMPFVGDNDQLDGRIDELERDIATYGRLLGRCVNGTTAHADDWARSYYLDRLGELVAEQDRLNAEAARRRVGYWMTRPGSPYAVFALQTATKAAA